jgi:hypothetical protein
MPICYVQASPWSKALQESSKTPTASLHVSLYAEGIVVVVATTPFALRRPSTELCRWPLGQGPTVSRRYCSYTPRVSTTPMVTRAPRGRSTPTSYAEGCRRCSVRRGHIPIRRRLEALGWIPVVRYNGIYRPLFKTRATTSGVRMS